MVRLFLRVYKQDNPNLNGGKYFLPINLSYSVDSDGKKGYNNSRNWVWRSLVARLNGVQEAGSSNLLTQTIFLSKRSFGSFIFLSESVVLRLIDVCTPIKSFYDVKQRTRDAGVAQVR